MLTKLQNKELYTFDSNMTHDIKNCNNKDYDNFYKNDNIKFTKNNIDKNYKKSNNNDDNDLIKIKNKLNQQKLDQLSNFELNQKVSKIELSCGLKRKPSFNLCN
jgi:hypothetical protein